jgi:hypothetical protein
VQHAAHFLGRQVDRRIAAVRNDEAVAVAVAFYAAFEFAQQGSTVVYGA